MITNFVTAPSVPSVPKDDITPAGGAWQYPESPPRKVKRRYLKCHCCKSHAVYYSMRRARCICEACQAVFDPLTVAANNRIVLNELARRIITKGA